MHAQLPLTFDRKSPLISRIRERRLLNGPGAEKRTFHVSMELSDPRFRYRVGDSIGIYPQNDPRVVERTLQAAGLTGKERVKDERKEEELLLEQYLSERANLASVTKKGLKKMGLEKGDLYEELKEGYAWWEALLKVGSFPLEPQDLVDTMQPLLPRLYSIASSQNVVGDEVHLTVSLLAYETRGVPRFGVCTYYLCELAQTQQTDIPIYLQPTKDFLLPEDPRRPIIMVGPGTGIAPFRAFMQERALQGGGGKNWLFFGEWHALTDFYYQDYWDSLVKQGLLRVSTAFSRDQAHKVYVQHRMKEASKELWSWLQEGAILYVCGDADRMAKDVDRCLHEIAMEEGALSEEEAKAYWKQLRKEKRYLRDVY